MTDLIRRADALAKIHWLSNADWTAAERRAAGEIAATINSMPAVTVGVETCSRCCGCGMTIGDGGDPRICPKCKGDGVEPVAPPDLTDPVTVHANLLRGTIAKPTVEQIIHLYGVDALTKALAPVIVREAEIDNDEDR